MKKVLFVIPDYNKTALRLIDPFHKAGFKPELVVPYKLSFALRLIAKIFIDSNAGKKIQRRIMDFDYYVPFGLKIISKNPLLLLYYILEDKYYKRFYLANSFKTLIERDIIKKIVFEDYEYVFTFDTIALIYLYAAKKHNIKTIMELRGNLIDHSLTINELINKQYGLRLDTIENSKNIPDKIQWYGKLRNEPSYCNYLLVYSLYQKKQLIKEGFPENKIIQIPISSAVEQTYLQNKIKGNDKIVFLYVGNVNYYKGIRTLIDAWKLVIQKYNHTIELVIAGDIFDEFKVELEQIPPNIKIKGYLFKKELIETYEMADVFIMPSYNDSYGQVVVEALSFTIPVICSPNVGASDLIVQFETGIVYNDPFNIEELANSISYFIENPKEIKRMSENIRNSNLSFSRETEKKVALDVIRKHLS